MLAAAVVGVAVLTVCAPTPALLDGPSRAQPGYFELLEVKSVTRDRQQFADAVLDSLGAPDDVAVRFVDAPCGVHGAGFAGCVSWNAPTTIDLPADPSVTTAMNVRPWLIPAPASFVTWPVPIASSNDLVVLGHEYAHVLQMRLAGPGGWRGETDADRARDEAVAVHFAWWLTGLTDTYVANGTVSYSSTMLQQAMTLPERAGSPFPAGELPRPQR